VGQVHLREAFPILLMYPPISDPDGTTYIYRDIYERDARLLQNLKTDIFMDLPD
jgi:murein L,D-transpeptidase YcbB/YkuD